MKKGFRILKFKKDKPIFEIKDVSKSFDGRPILKKLSLKVFPGECVGVLGPNGCGKTTLFSMCIGEQSPEGGKIFLNNKSIEQIPIHLRAKEGLGYLPQQRSVFNMSVYDNIMGIAQISIRGIENQKSREHHQIIREQNRRVSKHHRSLPENNSREGGSERKIGARAVITWYEEERETDGDRPHGRADRRQIARHR